MRRKVHHCIGLVRTADLQLFSINDAFHVGEKIVSTCQWICSDKTKDVDLLVQRLLFHNEKIIFCTKRF